MGATFLVNFCRSCPKGFRAAEMNGLSKLFDFPEYLAECLQDETRPYVICNIDSALIDQILSRSVLIKSITEIYASATSYATLLENLHEKKSSINTLVTPSSSFAIWVDAIGKELDQRYKVERIEALSFLDIRGTIDLDHPDIHFHLLEFCGEDSSQRIKQPLEIFFGRLVGKGRLRTLPSSYDLKTRNYIGNTSMDPLFSFIATNLAAVAKNDIVYDPFVGTGSLLLPAAHFGAYCFGNDINYNTIFGRGKSSRAGVKIKQRHENIRSNFEQYESIEHFIGILCADSSRDGFLVRNEKKIIDAVITDPPYGIREKASKIGLKNEPAQNLSDEKALAESHSLRYPSKAKYSFYDTFLDLLNMAAEQLRIGGRLVYWLPILYKDHDDSSIPRHSALALIHKCEQKLSSSHGRLLICMEKISNVEPDNQAYVLRYSFEEITLRDQVFAANNEHNLISSS